MSSVSVDRSGVSGPGRVGRPGPRGALPTRRRIATLERKVAGIMTLVLVAIASILFFELSARERVRLVEAKTNAATMLVHLLAAGLGPAVDFGDAHDVAQRLEDLRQNPDITGAAVWSSGTAEPIAKWTTPSSPDVTPPGAGEKDGSTASDEWLTTTTTVVGPSNAPLGRIRLVFTLRPENEEFRKTRLRLFWVVSAIAGLTAFLLALLARRYVVGPLGRLAQAATALAEGKASTSIDLHTNDEIGDLARAFDIMGKAVVYRQEQLTKEIELAQRIQTSILPRDLDVPGLELAASMVPATEVGGDYYDVLPEAGGSWIGIGDVAGHGLDAGLIMLMMQSIVACVVTRVPVPSPVDVICVLNQVLYDAIRKRLRRDDHATLCILHYEENGHVAFAGAHEDIVVYRAKEARAELIPTPGTWVGGRRDIREGTTLSSMTLEPGDVVMLHTDGCTETRNLSGEDFGIDRLVAAFERVASGPVANIPEALQRAVSSWGTADDDVTFVVFRHLGKVPGGTRPS